MGFKNDIESGVICRYRLDDVIVDLMPTDEEILGFSNIWYKDGFKNAIDYTLQGREIKLLTAPYFLATKFEAFKNRGDYNGRTSHDFEDIVFLFENRPSIWKEIPESNHDLYQYLSKELSLLINHPSHVEWIDSHVERWSPPNTYNIIEKIKNLINQA